MIASVHIADVGARVALAITRKPGSTLNRLAIALTMIAAVARSPWVPSLTETSIRGTPSTTM